MSSKKKRPLNNEELYQKIFQFYHAAGKDLNMNDLFRNDSSRFDNFSIRLNTPNDGTILVDYSKNRITSGLMRNLLELARVRGVEIAINAMKTGRKNKKYKIKPVPYTTVRSVDFSQILQEPVLVNGIDILEESREFFEKMFLFVNAVHNGKWKGCCKKLFQDVVVIGQGGWVLASQMAVESLMPFNKGLRIHFITNSTTLLAVLDEVEKFETLVVIVSNELDEPVVLELIETTKAWFLKGVHRRHLSRHFFAVTNNKPNAKRIGIHPGNTFRFGEYVRECYSVWSTVGLPLALSIGVNDFINFLKGARFMDDHFQESPVEENIPIILAMIGIWYVNFFKAETQTVLPYDQYMHLFPCYLQNLTMKSNGKCYQTDGSEVKFPTAPITWGQSGTNGQHAFYQLLHQGTRVIPADFIIPAVSHNPVEDNKHHRILVANFLAQTEALMTGSQLGANKPSGDTADNHKKYKAMQGNRPSNSIVVRQITPFTLGALMALYEHKTFVQSVVWNTDCFVNPADAFFKEINSNMYEKLEGSTEATCDPSTEKLMTLIKKKMPITSVKDLASTIFNFVCRPQINTLFQTMEFYNLAALSINTYLWYLCLNNKLRDV